MNITKVNLLITLIITLFGCNNSDIKESKISNTIITVDSVKKIPVLNFGTFHMGETTDANKTEFDENDKKKQDEVKVIAEMLALFKPTVIIVETPPTYDKKLQKEYNEYLSNPALKFKDPSEIELLAFQLGRLSGTKRIYGIDHKMGYNYNIGNEMINSIDSTWHNKFYKDPLKYYPEVNKNEEKLNTLDKLKLTNHNSYLNFLIEVNAEMLAHVGSENGFEGADEATKFYQRNIRIYSNLNRIKLTKNDRVFVLMGAAHTAYLRDFISRSPKFEMVNTFDYLK